MTAVRQAVNNLILTKSGRKLLGYGILQAPNTEIIARGITKWAKAKMKVPPKIPKFDYSGDRNLQLPEFSGDETVLHSLGLNSDEIDETQKEILALRNANHKVQMEYILDQIRKEFGRSDVDDDSLELRIALLTMKIRNQIRHMTEKPKDKILKSILVENIQRRRKWLTELNQLDASKFNWLCDKLEITYTPYPRFNFYIPKRARARQEAVTKMLEMKEQKLQALKDKLDEERELYYSTKSKLLAAIEEDKARLDRETEELSNVRVQTGYPGEHGQLAVKLAYIEPIEREKWWRKHPKVLQMKFGDKYKHQPNRWEIKRGLQK